MTVINKQTEKLEFINPTFKIETYNGISIIRELKTQKINASQMCSSNGKAWRNFTKTKYWKGKLEAFKKSSFYKGQEDARIRAPSILAKNGIKPEFQGEYIHPKLIHFVAEWCSDEYAFKVAELMDSVNNRVHQQLQQLQLPDTPTNAKPIFEQTINNNIRFVSDNENKQCWGVRETDKFDYLDSWDKSYIRDQYNKFKEAINKINISINELKLDYPQLFE